MIYQIARQCSKFKARIDYHRNILSNAIPENPFHKSCCTYSAGIRNHYKSPGILLICSKSRTGLGQEQLLHNYGRRYYYVDRHRVQHFNPRGPRKLFRNPRILFYLVLATTGGAAALYYGNLETVPYTKRSHFVILSVGSEKQLGEMQFEQVKSSFKGKILPPPHPDSVRAKFIANNIIVALQRGLSSEKVWGEPRNALMVDESLSGSPVGGEMSKYEWGKEEIMEDKWVKDSQNHGKMYQPSTMHLEGWKWEILVVNEPLVNAFCLPGGKIVIFTGLLKHFKTDPEIATIIAHEIGHVVARHAAEQLTKNILFTIVQLVLNQFIMPDFVNTMSTFLLRLPFSRRCKVGKHTTEKPLKINPVALSLAKASPTAVGILKKESVVKGDCSRCKLGFFCSDHVTQYSKDGKVEAANYVPIAKKLVDINQPEICKNKGCGETFREKDNTESSCNYHPGPAIFHDMVKWWKCCDVHVKDFDEFMSIPPCTRGWHSATNHI